MVRIILIETSTALCSVALAEDGAIVDYRESSAPKAHASLTAVFIQDMLAERGLSPADCDAVCVSMGPGSYTGLRVGVSTAKGICFGARKPLLAVGTLDTLVAQALEEEIATDSANPRNDKQDTPDVIARSEKTNVIARSEATWQSPQYIIPMVDARRIEVYTAVFGIAVQQGEIATDSANPRNDKQDGNDGQQGGIATDSANPRNDKQDTPDVIARSETTNVIARSEATWQSPRYIQLTETAPMIIDENSFAEYLEQGPCLFIGDGAGKCADVIRHPNASFCQCNPKASSMLSPALAAYKEKRFEDVAYFEPFYLKEFVATVSKKKLF